jgi:branched-subunit amino acid transport protein
MTVWWVVLGLVVVCVVLRAVGPAVLGDRELPAPVRRVVTVLAPALLAGLVITEIGGERWTGLDPAMVAGVLVAGGARLVRVPALIAVVIGAAVAAGIRAFTG